MNGNNHSIEQSTPDKKSILEFLGKEIDNIQAEFTRPGWTNWAIIGGLATVAWLFYTEIELGKFDINRVLVLWLAFSLIYPFMSLFVFRFLIKLPLTPYLANDRFYYSKADGNTSLPILHLSLYVSGFFITKYLNTGRTQPYELSSYIFLSIIFFITFVGSISFLLGMPSSSDNEIKSTRQKVALFFLTLYALTGVFIASRYVLYLGGFKVFTVFDIRFFSLILATFFLIRLLVTTPAKKPILEQLIRINRDLSLGRIDSITAQKQIDVALYGLRSSDILQKYVDRYLKVMEQFNKEMQQVKQKVDIRNAMLNKKRKEPSSKDEILVESLRNDIVLHLNRIENSLNKDLNKVLLPLGLQTYSLASTSKWSSSHENNKRELLTVLIDVKSGAKAGFDEIQLIRETQGISSENITPTIFAFIDVLISRIT